MKKFTKASLILALFFAIVGVVSIVCAFAMGLNWKNLVKMVEDGDLVIQMDDSEDDMSFFKYEKENQDNGIDCKKLDIELSAGSLNIFYDDVDEIEVKQENVKNFSSQMNGDKLEIRGGKKIISSGTKGVITVIVPKGTVFEEVELNIGAGQADIDELCAEKVSIEVGAGQAKLSYLDTKKFEAEAGAGQITANLVGSEDAYSYKAECGIGEIKIGNSSIGGLGGKKNVSNQGTERYLDIECGVGQIQISFQK